MNGMNYVANYTFGVLNCCSKYNFHVLFMSDCYHNYEVSPLSQTWKVQNSIYNNKYFFANIEFFSVYNCCTKYQICFEKNHL